VRRALVTLSLALLAAGCVGGATARARALVSAGDVAGAVRAAGDDDRALEAVALETLMRAAARAGTRSSALRAMEAAGPRAGTALERLARSEDEATACPAIASLHCLGRRVEQARIDACLGSADPRARAAAARAMDAGLRPSALVARLLADPNPEVRLAAIEAVGRPDDARHAALLLPLVREGRAVRERAAALRALGRVGRAPDVVAAGKAAVGADDMRLRLAAIEALGRHLEDAQAARLVAAELGAESVVAARAASLLGRQGDHRGLEALARLLERGSEDAASTAAVGASEVGEPVRASLMLAIGRPEPGVRLRAAAALLRLADPGPAEQVLRRLLDEPGWVGLHAALLLGDRQPVARDRLDSLLEQGDEAMRAAIARQSPLVPCGRSLARRALADEAEAVRVAAAAALLRILDRSSGGAAHELCSGPAARG